MKRMLAMASAVCAVAAVAAIAASGAQAAVTQNTKDPLDISVFVDCANGGAGETVHLTGTLHTLFTYTINDNNVSGKFQDQPQQVSGTGDVTGATYQGTGVTQEKFQGSLQNGQYSETYVNNFRIIGQGSGNNYLVHETMHLTINANGDLTVDHTIDSAECM